MNLLLLEPEELSDSPEGAVAVLRGRRAQHAKEVLRAHPGDSLRVGVIGGKMGQGHLRARTGEQMELSVVLDSEPPPRPGIDVLLAIPRPKAMKKVLPALASLGVDRIVLLNAARVEKSYFQSNVLEPGTLRELLLLGLEQSRDTRLPELHVAPLFRPFVEDRLDDTFGTDGLRLLAHPAPEPTGPPVWRTGQRLVVAVGPEGGWVPFERELLQGRGFQPLSLGPRTLRVEVAVPFLLGRFDGIRQRA